MKLFRRAQGGDVEIGELSAGTSLYIKSDLSPETFAIRVTEDGLLSIRAIEGLIDVRPLGSNTVEIVPRSY